MTNPTVETYLNALPGEREAALRKLIEVFAQNLPQGFEICMSYNMPSFVVPLTLYPDGYHCKPGTPLPFISIASQKNFIALYHMGLYAKPELLQWFQEAYLKEVSKAPDMGKSCIRFKKPDQIPFSLIAELAQKMTPDEWINTYESLYKKGH